MGGFVALGVVLAALAQGAVEAARGLWERGERLGAIEVLERAVAADPADREARRALAEAEVAVHRYSAALKHADGLGDDLAGLRGTAWFRLGELEEALRHLGRERADELRMRVDALEALGRVEESDAELARLVEVAGEDAWNLAARGKAAARRGETERAEALFRRALALDPCEPAALHGLGRALAKLGRRDEALRWLEEHRRVTPLLDQLDFARRAVDLAPAHGPNHAAVGDAERALGRVAAAAEAYERAAKLAKADELAPIVLRLARLLAEDRGELDAAVARLDGAFEVCRDARLAVRAGDLLLAAGRREEALARFEKARELRPGDGEIARRVQAAKDAR